MPPQQPSIVYRFGIFEADPATGELRRKGTRIKLNAQPFQVLLMLLDRPGALVTREEIARELWPDGIFVDYEHGVHAAVNRIREALGDKAGSPRFVETLARRGYRFIGPIERLEANPGAASGSSFTAKLDATDDQPPSSRGPDAGPANQPSPEAPHSAVHHWFNGRILASPHELPEAPHRTVRTLFLLLQLMYLGFYVGALANLGEIQELFAALPRPALASNILIVTGAILIPARAFVLCAVLFRAPRRSRKFLSMWPWLLPFDILWALSPFLLLHHINFGLATACTALLIYAPFAQRSLVLMGAAGKEDAAASAAAR